MKPIGDYDALFVSLVALFISLSMLDLVTTLHLQTVLADRFIEANPWVTLLLLTHGPQFLAHVKFIQTAILGTALVIAYILGAEHRTVFTRAAIAISAFGAWPVVNNLLVMLLSSL